MIRRDASLGVLDDDEDLPLVLDLPISATASMASLIASPPSSLHGEGGSTSIASDRARSA